MNTKFTSLYGDTKFLRKNMKLKKHLFTFLISMMLWGRLLDPVYADLIDRGNGMIYDTALKMTWLKDANYARTSGYDDDGRMSWDEATAWVEGLVYAGYSDWRLPALRPATEKVFNYDFSDAGNTDIGYNVTSKKSELAYMFYVNLGNKGWNDTAGQVSGCMPPTYCLTNNGVFDNLQHYVYWFGTEYERFMDRAWTFYTFDGLQNYHNKENEFYAWPVRSGDVGT